jgi:hypothetical protein
MTVIFQLFCAEDLKKLTYAELTQLRTIVADALGLTKTATSQDPSPLCLGVMDKTQPDIDPPDEVKKALNKRFDEVSHQLKSPQLNPPGQTFNFDERLEQHANPSSVETEILKWAISCEVNNFEFYEALRKAKKAAYEFFAKAMIDRGETVPERLRPKGPDSAYSPFNPRHPLYNLYYNLPNP